MKQSSSSRLRLAAPLFFFCSLRLAAAELSPTAAIYPINDQHDTVSILLQDAITDRNVHRLEGEARVVRHAMMIKMTASVPGETIYALENEIAQDALTAPSDEHRVKSLESKLRGLKALRNGQDKEFQQADRDANRELLAHFEMEERKATMEVTYTGERYARIHATVSSGATSWARDQEALLTHKKAQATLEGWKRKVAEQTRQTKAAEQELKPENKR
jgi:hypothetical protein